MSARFTSSISGAAREPLLLGMDIALGAQLAIDYGRATVHFASNSRSKRGVLAGISKQHQFARALTGDWKQALAEQLPRSVITQERARDAGSLKTSREGQRCRQRRVR